jgi:hypothetical protein
MEKEMNNPGPQQINLELGEKEAEGIYANFAIINHTPAEFVLDFARIFPGVPKAKIQTRIIMTPQHAKSLARALQENIEKFEASFGEIKVFGEQRAREFGFQPPNEAPEPSRT